MLAEVLLVLGGYTSPLLSADGVAPSLAAHLHPGEVAALAALGALAADFRDVRDWAESTQAAARAAVLRSSKIAKGGKSVWSEGKEEGKEEGPGQYVAVLAGSVRGVLAEYTALVVQTEERVLKGDSTIVQPSSSSSLFFASSSSDPFSTSSHSTSPPSGEGTFVPLSLLLSTFETWRSPLLSLRHLIGRLSANPTPGELMGYLLLSSSSGDPTLRRIFSTLVSSVWQLFLSHLTMFLLDGVAPETSTPSSPALGLDVGADPPHRAYRLNNDLLPSCVGAQTRESILYVGRVAATLKREGRALPKSLTDGARKEVLGADVQGLERAVERVRAEVGEWLWTHILTGVQVAEAIEGFANYFLTRDADFAANVIREIQRLRYDRLVTGNPTSSSSVIRAHDLDLALLRASVGTAAESDRNLEALSWSMPDGPLKPSSLSILTPSRVRQTADASLPASEVRTLFAPALLGAPIALTSTVSWPLNLFMTGPALAAYGDMHAYLLAIRDTHARVLDTWTKLSHAQRRRRVYTGTHEGGGDKEEQGRRTALARKGWGLVRAMLWILDSLLAHFMTDIVGAQHRRLLDSLSHAAPGGGQGISPGRGAGYLDFLTLRQMHARHLAFLREGLLIADRESAILVRDMLDTCKRFCGLVDRWGGDVLPELLSDDEGDVVGERVKVVDEVSDTLHNLISDLFRLLLDTQAPPAADASVSGSDSVAGASTARQASLSRASLSRGIARVTQIMSLQSRSRTGISVGDEHMGRHVEQLLLRLDFNGVLTAWQEGKVRGSVLAGID